MKVTTVLSPDLQKMQQLGLVLPQGVLTAQSLPENLRSQNLGNKNAPLMASFKNCQELELQIGLDREHPQTYVNARLIFDKNSASRKDVVVSIFRNSGVLIATRTADIESR